MLAIDASKRERRAGFALFFLVTALWALWCSLGLTTWDDIPAVVSPADVGGVIAVIPSALSVIATGYLLGRRTTLIWLGLIPGALMTAIGSVGFNSDLVWLLYFGLPLLIFGWPLYFLPLLGLGAYLRGRRVKRRVASVLTVESGTRTA